MTVSDDVEVCCAERPAAGGAAEYGRAPAAEGAGGVLGSGWPTPSFGTRLPEPLCEDVHRHLPLAGLSDANRVGECE